MSYLNCSAGTTYESAEALIARVQQTRLDARVGYPQAIIDACKAAGAFNVAIFRSDYGGEALDAGLNVTYVGDSGYVGNADLVKACTIAVRAARVGGDNMQVLPMARAVVDVTADVYLRAAPTSFDLSRLENIHHAAIRQYIAARVSDYGYSRVGLTAAISRNTTEVQDVIFSSPSADISLLTGGNFPDVLNRYAVGNISLRYLSP